MTAKLRPGLKKAWFVTLHIVCGLLVVNLVALHFDRGGFPVKEGCVEQTPTVRLRVTPQYPGNETWQNIVEFGNDHYIFVVSESESGFGNISVSPPQCDRRWVFFQQNDQWNVRITGDVHDYADDKYPAIIDIGGDGIADLIDRELSGDYVPIEYE